MHDWWTYKVDERLQDLELRVDTILTKLDRISRRIAKLEHGPRGSEHR